MDRRHFLRATGALAAGFAGCTASQSTGQPTADATPTETVSDLPEAIGLETLASGLRAPLDIAFAPDADRRYVAEQQGVVSVHEADGLRSEPLLDLRDQVTAGGEKGLLGIALHPDFATNRRLFVRYSSPPRQGTPDSYSHTFVLSEFQVSQDGRSVVDGSEQTVLEIPEPQGNHNAGAIVFGADGYLYIGVGDGGAGGDQGRGHVDDWYDRVGGGNGQDVQANLLGSILRIDVDGSDGDQPYAIPDDNPLVDGPGLDEYYAWGFRNPWRLAVDGQDLYAGDVGQNRFEEIDRVVAGGNYGWNVKEGTHCYGADNCPDSTPASVRGGEPLLDPVVEYPHSGAAVSGISVIVGNVYRASAIPGLDGQLVFGDYRTGGDLFVATPQSGDGLWPTAAIPIADGDAGKLSQLLSFGRHEGELYALGIGDGGGGVHRLVAPDG
ncbi:MULTISPECIES: PQQ-dependent sugar dehydrogenase [Salinibaculum]|uniref:PQQ-dependent sugar dehydrogenase n=1 Tax=Salinibaculum TaxID=2732368 RepID=UPI0030D34D39